MTLKKQKIKKRKDSNKKKTINKILYYLSIFSIIVFLIIIMELLKEIFSCGLEGYIFIACFILFMCFELYQLIINRDNLKQSFSYNGLLIITTIYLVVIFLRIYDIKHGMNSVLYDLDIKYCKINFLVLGLILLAAVLNSRVLIKSNNVKR